MKKDTIFYLDATWHASIFDSICVFLQAGNVNFGTFGGVAHPHQELINFIFAFSLCVCTYSKFKLYNILTFKKIELRNFKMHNPFKNKPQLVLM